MSDNTDDYAESRQLDADSADLSGQIQDREYALESGRITEEEYRNWDFEFGPADPNESGSAVPLFDPNKPGNEPPF